MINYYTGFEDDEVSSEKISDSHNQNCFDYLANIKNTPLSMLELFPKELNSFLRLEEEPKYNPSVSYANLYTSFLTTLEMNIEKFEAFFLDQQKALEWLNQIFCNDNQILQKTFERFEESLSSRTLDEPRPEQLIAATMDNFDPKNQAHETTPAFEGSKLGRFSALLSNNYKPMFTTSIPSTRDYEYTKRLRQEGGGKYPQELRFGTQAQRHEGAERVSPLFMKWLDLKSKIESSDEIHHVYFNLLAYDRKDFEGSKEARMTQALEGLESNPKVVVITLPADKGLMNKSYYTKTDESSDAMSAKNFYEMIYNIAVGQKDVTPIQDFRVSIGAKIKLYGVNKQIPYNKSGEAETIKKLLNKSFDACGVSIANLANSSISKAQQQAIWFHFCKFEFPNFVLEQLKPNTWNVSCKDAIDRGGVASAYYNLMKSFEKKPPMSRVEFEQALHAAAALVKGRGLNHHYEIIWNAINYYVNANFDLLKSQDKQWLIHWRNDNTPYAIAQSYDYLKKVLDQNTMLLEQSDQSMQVTKALEIWHKVHDELFEGELIKPITGKRLLLEVVSQVTQAATSNNPAQPKKSLDNVLKKLEEQSIFKPLCKLLKGFIDLIVKLFPQMSQLKGKSYSSLVRHSNDRENINGIKQKLNEMKADQNAEVNNLTEGAGVKLKQ